MVHHWRALLAKVLLTIFLAFDTYFPVRLSASLMSTLSIWSGLISFFSATSIKLISHVLSLKLVRKVRMNNKPSSCMKVLISDALGFSVEFEPEVSWRENVESWWCSVLNDECWLLSFGDYSAESGEWISDGFCISKKLRYGVLMVNSICFFLVENKKAIAIGCLKTTFIIRFAIMIYF